MILDNTRCNFATSTKATLIGSLCIVGNVYCAQSTMVTGVVVDQNDAPVIAASIVCKSGKNAITRGPEPVDLRGRFQIAVGTSVTHLTCTFSAPDFEPKTRTVPNRNGAFDISNIRLTKTARLTAGPLVRSLTADARFLILDAIVSNPTTFPVDMVSMQVNASAFLSTACFDPRPTIVFTIQDSVALKRLNNSESSLPAKVESPPTNWNETTTAKGRLERLGCRQERLALQVNYLARFKPGDQEKVRIAIPQRIGVNGATPLQIALNNWQAIELKLMLADGSSISTTLK